MKKLIALAAALCIALMLVPAVADEEVTGEWYASYMGLTMKLTLNADNTASMELGGREPMSGSWSREGEKITIVLDGIAEQGTVADGVLRVVSGEETVEFSREAAGFISVAAVNPNATEADFTGEWSAAYVDLGGGMLIEAAAAGDSIPGLVIEDSVLKFARGSSFGDMFGGIAMSWEGGALVCRITLADDVTGGLPVVIRAAMLEDGMLELTIDMTEGASTLYYTKAAE